ncbi:response regulator transcription factor [Steroidobacter sp.]|uniref:response regulator transcription factor n=1 Tax=Steroidobacter sp. TaxID=1978227 RepID=UPI001A5434E8|nr:response regulator transcription factor [Steroidobacter sp.]MBL8265441.1 response regulator transcription factor [Steroidobacter sp.]
MTHPTSQRVLLIDDDAELSRMLKQYLAGEGFEMSSAADGEEGVQAALSGQFDAVLLDVMMPRMNGIEALRRIRRVSDVPVIMLTARGEGLDRVAGLETGADDYIAKPYYPLELVARLRAVLRRHPKPARPDKPSSLQLGNLELSVAQRRVVSGSTAIDLTATEFNVLEALLRSGDAVISKDELSMQALSRKREPYDRSIDVHVSNIRQKLTAAGATAQIETVRGIGYRIGLP